VRLAASPIFAYAVCRLPCWCTQMRAAALQRGAGAPCCQQIRASAAWVVLPQKLRYETLACSCFCSTCYGHALHHRCLQGQAEQAGALRVRVLRAEGAARAARRERARHLRWQAGGSAGAAVGFTACVARFYSARGAAGHADAELCRAGRCCGRPRRPRGSSCAASCRSWA